MNKPLYSENSLSNSTQNFNISTNFSSSCQSQKPHWFEKQSSSSELKKKFILILFATLFFGFLQLVLSYFSSSLALINDSFHQIIDSSNFLVCILAINFSKKKGNTIFTYGYHRLEILGALFCNLILILLMFTLLIGSINRLYSTYYEEGEVFVINTSFMIKGAIVGIVCDFFLLFVLKSKSFFKFYHGNHNCAHSH